MALIAMAVQVVEAIDAAALAAALTGDPEGRQRDGANARWDALTALDWERVAQGLQDVACDLQGICLGCAGSDAPTPAAQRRLEF